MTDSRRHRTWPRLLELDSEVIPLSITLDIAVPDVFITPELHRRAPRKTDYLREKLAIQELAQRMAAEPEQVLPRFVELAMELTGGASAGVSLYEENPSPGVFRWHYLHGTLAPFNGATTPRNFSPCGITLDQNAPVLSAHPERVYDWISAANIVVPEVLLVPLYLGGDEPLGTLWIVSEHSGHFDSGDARVTTELASFLSIALRMVQSEQRLQRALEEQQMLTREMSHRVKNVFAMIDGMIRFSAKGALSKDGLARTLSGRVHALARAHGLVRRSFGDGAIGADDFGEVIRTIVLPHDGDAERDTSRFDIDGPRIVCGERAINGVALVIHELTTNAAKYGALSVDSGHVGIHWQIDGADVILRWIEAGGPEIAAPPEASGFGSTLVSAMVQGQFSGTLSYEWLPTGLAATITMPLVNLTQ